MRREKFGHTRTKQGPPGGTKRPPVSGSETGPLDQAWDWPLDEQALEYPSRDQDTDFLDQLQAAVAKDPERTVEVLLPIGGKLIRHYLRERWQGLFKRQHKQVPANPSTTIPLSKVRKNGVQQVWLIERGSGRIKTSLYPAAQLQAIDHSAFLSELVAATAYRSGSVKDEEEVLLCGPYQAYLRRFVTHAVAVVFCGTLTPRLRRKVNRRVQEFYQACMATHLDLVFASPFGKLPNRQIDEVRLRQQLHRSFSKFHG